MLQFGGEYSTFRNIADAVRAARKISQLPFPRIELPVSSRAIMPLVRRRSDGYLRRRRNLCNTSRTIANNLDLRIELRFISKLLKIAPAPPAKVRTRRLDANRRRLDDLRDRGKGHLAAQPINS